MLLDAGGPQQRPPGERCVRVLLDAGADVDALDRTPMLLQPRQTKARVHNIDGLAGWSASSAAYRTPRVLMNIADAGARQSGRERRQLLQQT